MFHRMEIRAKVKNVEVGGAVKATIFMSPKEMESDLRTFMVLSPNAGLRGGFEACHHLHLQLRIDQAVDELIAQQNHKKVRIGCPVNLVSHTVKVLNHFLQLLSAPPVGSSEPGPEDLVLVLRPIRCSNACARTVFLLPQVHVLSLFPPLPFSVFL